MGPKPGITLVTPCFNERENLEILLPDWIPFCRTHGYRLIIVDDGSTDGTSQFLRSIEAPDVIRIVHHKLNRGYGAALKSGIQEAATPYIATIDADGQHFIASVAGLFEAMTASDADMVIGCRTRSSVSRPFRSTGKWIIRRFVKILFRKNFSDLNSGMKLFQAAPAKKYIRICPNTMAFSDIFALIFANQGHRIVECPITIEKRAKGRSKIQARTAVETIWEIINISVLFKPLKVFLFLAGLFFVLGLGWGIPILLAGRGVSVGAGMLILVSVLFLAIGLLAEELSTLIRMKIE